MLDSRYSNVMYVVVSVDEDFQANVSVSCYEVIEPAAAEDPGPWGGFAMVFLSSRILDLLVKLQYT